MTQFPELFAALAAPFEPGEVKLRSGRSGRQVPYITARAAMNRLDSVLGPENWWDEYVAFESSVMCRLTLRLPDGSTVTKCDAGGYAGMALKKDDGQMVRDEKNDAKSAFSDAFKRAAGKFGVARYLFHDGIPSYATATVAKPAAAARPATAAKATTKPAAAPHAAVAEAPVAQTEWPRTGRALFAWTRRQDETGARGLLRHLDTWGRAHDFPPRMVDWTGDQVAQAFAEATRHLHEPPPGPGKARQAAETT